MLASRLLSILLRLQTRGRMTATELAGEFEVAVRTIHRDIDQLSAAGIPVYAERGRNGGFRLRDGYRTTLTGLTRPEAEALFLTGLPGPAEQLGLAGIASSARLKLMAALPANIQEGAERMAARFHLDAAGWFRGTDLLPSLHQLAEATWGRPTAQTTLPQLRPFLQSPAHTGAPGPRAEGGRVVPCSPGRKIHPHLPCGKNLRCQDLLRHVCEAQGF
jgi:predicted DNA-binding transcriptional regulator YafY